MKVTCEFCGAEYEDPASIFCEKCGYKMQRVGRVRQEEVVEYARCNFCGHRNPEGTRTCFNCGNLIYTRRL